jgi:uncharacterized protein YaaN involved in tellurite resistance
METALATKSFNAIESLNEEQIQKAREIAAQVKTEDSQAVVAFGVGAQKEMSEFADNVLEQIRSKDSGFVGEILTDLVCNIKDLDVGGLNPDKKSFFGGLATSVKRFLGKYDKLDTQLDKIVGELDVARINLFRDITLLDNMYALNIQYLKNLDIFIAAGQLKLQEFKNQILPEAQLKAQSSSDPMIVQNYNDLVQFVDRFEKKVHDLLLSRMIAIQTVPQIRLIQSGNQTLVEKIQSSILNTIPLWKNQIVIAITIFRQKKGLEAQKKVTDTTNDLLKRNAELLKQGAISVAKENERGIVDIETLKKTNADLISTIEEVIQIQSEGRSKRQTAEQELIKLESELKNTLISQIK